MTAQVGDSILIDGITHELCVLPLENLFKVMPDRPKFVPQSSANWRGYVALWKIENDRLWLIGLHGQVDTLSEERIERPLRLRRSDEDLERKQGIVSRIERLAEDSFGIRQSDREWFGHEIESENGQVDTEVARNITTKQLLNSNTVPLSAAWYSGLLRIPVGDELAYVHGGFHSEYEKDLVIEVEAGKVRKQWLINNKPGHEARQRKDASRHGSSDSGYRFSLLKQLAIKQRAIEFVAEEHCALCAKVRPLDRQLFRANLSQLPIRESLCEPCVMAFWSNQGLFGEQSNRIEETGSNRDSDASCFPISADEIEKVGKVINLVRRHLPFMKASHIRSASAVLAALERLPAVTPGINISFGYINRREGGNYAWADIFLSEDEFRLGVGEHFYDPEVGGDTESRNAFEVFAGMPSSDGDIDDWLHVADVISADGEVSVEDDTDYDSIDWSGAE